MSDLENKQSTSEAEFKEQCAGLGQQLNLLLYGLVAVSLTLTGFLALQAKRAGTELDMIKPQALQVLEMSKRNETGVRAFLGQLLDYGKTHPDYQPILQKYNVKMVEPPPGVMKAPAPAPSPAPAPAK